MSSDLSEIDVFAEGIRPPTIFEYLTEWAEEKRYELREIEHRITARADFGGMFCEEVDIKLVIPEHTMKAMSHHPAAITLYERVVIGMQGPGTLHPRNVEHMWNDISAAAVCIKLKGVITYDG